VDDFEIDSELEDEKSAAAAKLAAAAKHAADARRALEAKQAALAKHSLVEGIDWISFLNTSAHASIAINILAIICAILIPDRTSAEFALSAVTAAISFTVGILSYLLLKQNWFPLK
jgi:hypothetical protein